MLEPISISLESLNLGTLTPMLIILTGALAIIIIDLIKKDLHKSLYIMLSLMFLLLDLGSVLGLEYNERGFFDVMLIDGIAILSQIIIIAGSLLFIPLAFASKRFHEYNYPEYFALFLFMVAGLQFMVATDNLILIFVGLETASLALYTMIAMHNKDKSFEAAVKYFAIGALAAGFYAFGAMILYGLTGTVEIDKIAEVLAARNFEPMGYIVLGSLMIFVTLAFKMALVPFHTWAPDVYEGSSAALAGYMAAIPKVAVFVVTIRLFEMLVHANIVWVEYVLYASVVLTMTLANIWALVQKDVKRMLAYSSISHAGFVLAAILIGTTQANSALFFYWILFTFASLGSFAMLWLSHQKTIPSHWTSDYPFEKFQGLMHTLPMAALMMGIFMFALAGIPPFSLFFGKMYLIGAAVSAGEIVLALIMALNSALAAYYYLKLVIYMFLKEPLNKDKSVYMMNSSLSLKTIIGVSVFLTTFAFIWANDILEFVTYYVYVSGY